MIIVQKKKKKGDSRIFLSHIYRLLFSPPKKQTEKKKL